MVSPTDYSGMSYGSQSERYPFSADRSRISDNGLFFSEDQDPILQNGMRFSPDLSILQKIYKTSRTKIQSMETVEWLRSRCLDRAQQKYLLYPEEVKQHENIKEIFDTFDQDHSLSLDIHEIAKMFQHYKIDITKKDLEELFAVVDTDHDSALNFREFKNCALSESADRVFRAMIRKVREKELEKPEAERLVYLPNSFSGMVTYLSYCMVRERLIKNFKKESDTVGARFKVFKRLFNFKDITKTDNLTDLPTQIKQKVLERRAGRKTDPDDISTQLYSAHPKDGAEASSAFENKVIK